MLLVFLDVVEIEEVAVAVEEPVLLLDVLLRQEAAEAVVRHMAAGGDVGHVHAAQLLAPRAAQHLGKVERAVGERVLVLELQVVLVDEQEYRQARAGQEHDQRGDAEIEENDLKQQQRVQAEHHDQHPAQDVQDIGKQPVAAADDVLFEIIHHTAIPPAK